jgi:hypothetical protein
VGRRTPVHAAPGVGELARSITKARSRTAIDRSSGCCSSMIHRAHLLRHGALSGQKPLHRLGRPRGCDLMTKTATWMRASWRESAPAARPAWRSRGARDDAWSVRFRAPRDCFAAARLSMNTNAPRHREPGSGSPAWRPRGARKLFASASRLLRPATTVIGRRRALDVRGPCAVSDRETGGSQ